MLLHHWVLNPKTNAGMRDNDPVPALTVDRFTHTDAIN